LRLFVLLLTAVLIAILALHVFQTWVSKNSTYDVVVAVDNRIRTAIQGSLNQYKLDLVDEGQTCSQWNVTADGLSSLALRDHLTEFWRTHRVKGCVLVGDFPYARWEEGGNQHPTDYFYMDLDGEWIDVDGDGAYEKHKGSVEPEIWVGRIQASNVEGNESELLNNYFEKNHHYRTKAGSPTWPRQALAYIDSGIANAAPIGGDSEVYFAYVENTTLCLEMAYGQEATVIHDTFADNSIANAQDYLHRLNSTDGYEMVWLYSHGYQWSAPYYGHHVFDRSNVYWEFYLRNSPKVFFYIWDVCEAAEFSSPNCLGSSAIFGNGWGLVSIGMTASGIPQCQFFEFFDMLKKQENVGEAFKAFWNCTIDMNGRIDFDESKKWVILGDPTLHLPTVS